MYFSRLQGIASLEVHAPVSLSFPPSPDSGIYQEPRLASNLQQSLTSGSQVLALQVGVTMSG